MNLYWVPHKCLSLDSEEKSVVLFKVNSPSLCTQFHLFLSFSKPHCINCALFCVYSCLFCWLFPLCLVMYSSDLTSLKIKTILSQVTNLPPSRFLSNYLLVSTLSLHTQIHPLIHFHHHQHTEMSLKPHPRSTASGSIQPSQSFSPPSMTLRSPASPAPIRSFCWALSLKCLPIF